MPLTRIAPVPTIEKNVFWALVALIVLVLGMYVYLVNATVMNIVDRKAAERHAQEAQSHIGELESRYLALSSGITPDYARTLGFGEVKSEDFAVRKTLTYAPAALARAD